MAAASAFTTTAAATVSTAATTTATATATVPTTDGGTRRNSRSFSNRQCKAFLV